MILGSADILLTELLALLTPGQAAVLAPGRGLPRPDDPRRPRLRPQPRPGPPSTGAAAGARSLAELRADVARLADLTLLAAGPGHRDAPVDRRAGHPQHRR